MASIPGLPLGAILGGLKTALETLQLIIAIKTYLFEAIQLKDELERLRATLPRALMLISLSEGGMLKDKELAKLLSYLKDTASNAEDLLREMDDQGLQQRIEEAERGRAGQLLSSSLNIAKNLFRDSKRRIKETQDKLDKAVVEIEGVLNLMGLMSVAPSQIMVETSSVISAEEVVGRETERDTLIEKLGVMIRREVQQDQVIKLLGAPPTGGRRSLGSNRKRAAEASDGVASTSIAKRPKGDSGQAGLAVTNCTSNVSVIPIVGVGGANRKRAAEASNSVASASRAKRPKGNSGQARLAVTNCTSNVSVILIVGVGGVGKTTLAQLIYNDPRVESHFSVMIWVCVSDFFDKRRITNEIIESIPPIPGKEFNPACSLNALQIELMERLKMCPRFLLVLDDVWPNANDDWEAFYAPLRHGPEGSMILVTTRFPVVATHVTTSNREPIQLQGLPNDIFWDLFRKCAFGTNVPESYPYLQDIGQSICTRLCGSPLAAKTLGRLLNMRLTEQHWRAVQRSELWELQHEPNEILPALQLSYLYLPEEVKRCFLFLSMFPKNYSFKRDEIVDIWVAEGFLAHGGSMRPEDVGITYLDVLRNRFLLQTDPKFPNETRYVMHDLIHDMAVSFSMDECLVMQDLRNQKKSRMQCSVCHMPIEVDGESLTRMGDIQHLSKLHSLRFGIRFGVEITWSRQLSNIVFLSLKGCNLVKLPECLCELNSLRYLDVSHSSVEELPVKLRCLCNLQVLDARCSSLKIINQYVTKLINLCQLALPEETSLALSKLSGLGNLSCLRKLSTFRVSKKEWAGNW